MEQDKRERLEKEIAELRKLHDIVENKRADTEGLKKKYSILLAASMAVSASTASTGFSGVIGVACGATIGTVASVVGGLCVIGGFGSFFSGVWSQLSEEEMLQAQLKLISDTMSARENECRLLSLRR